MVGGRSLTALTSLVALVSLTAVPVAGQDASPRWFKGNTHTHTLNSDGDSTPDEVVRWYREHRYHFLVLSDHNFLTSVTGLTAVHGADGKFLLIPGEEVTDRFGDKPLHVNGLNPRTLVEPQGGTSVADTLQRNVERDPPASRACRTSTTRTSAGRSRRPISKRCTTTGCSRSSTVTPR